MNYKTQIHCQFLSTGTKLERILKIMSHKKTLATNSYGVQGLGGTLVKKIDGDYYNVVGLPLYRLCNELSSQLKLWTSS